jgi:hypothetical protein
MAGRMEEDYMKFDKSKIIRLIACGASFLLILQAGHLPAGGPPKAFDLAFSTYFGGSDGEMVRDMVADAQGDLFVSGVTSSPDFPKTPSGLPCPNTKAGGVVAKYNPAGGLVWSRVCGAGTAHEGAYFYTVKVDKAGYVYVAGRMPPGFPTTPGAFQPTTQHPCGFIGKIKPDASAWVWASYVGTGFAVRDMAQDDQGNLYGVLDFYEESKELLPKSWFAHAFQKTPHGGGDHFGKSDAGIIKISPEGKVLWASWIGGANGNDWVASVGVAADHCPVIMLHTWSKDMPTTPGAFSSSPSIGWLGKLSEDGSKLIFGTYFSDAFPRTHNVAIDRHGNIFIGSCTKNWPVTPRCFQPKYGGGPEDFAVAKFSPAGKLLAATYLGGSGHEINGPDEIVIDARGNVVIGGSSSSMDYPVTPGAFQAKNAGEGGKFPYDGVVSILSSDLSTLIYSTSIGGAGDDMVRAVFAGLDGSLYMGGDTTSQDFPLKNAYQPKYGGDAGYSNKPNSGESPVGWGTGEAWLAKFKAGKGTL